MKYDANDAGDSLVAGDYKRTLKFIKYNFRVNIHEIFNVW